MFNYRLYQSNDIQSIESAYVNPNDCVLYVLPTGGGKTVVIAGLIDRHAGCTIVIAHRQELVKQASLTLAQAGIQHDVIAPNKTVKKVIKKHITKLKKNFVVPGSRVYVASVDTLTSKSRREMYAQKLKNISFWIVDEGHHVQKENKWGRAVNYFPKAKGLLVTATATRADGGGLGIESDGVCHHIVEGPKQRELINMGYLVDYKIIAPPSDIDYSDVKISSKTGDYVEGQASDAINKSTLIGDSKNQIIGDVVKHWLKYAKGKLTITFATDVATSNKIADEFNLAGVPAKVVSAKTPDDEREEILLAFERREILQLINCDLFGEGFDVPAVECVQMVRKTQSFSLFVQQAGRALRLLIDEWIEKHWETFTPERRRQEIAKSKKPFALIIDHVGNAQQHAVGVRCELTNKLIVDICNKEWTLEPRSNKNQGEETELKTVTCPNPACNATYIKISMVCPYCGFKPVAGARSSPEFVDGDLTLLDPATLENIKSIVVNENKTIDEYRDSLKARGVPFVGVLANVKRHNIRLKLRGELRRTIGKWVIEKRMDNADDAFNYRLFYSKFGVDVATAFTLNAGDTSKLITRLQNDIE